MQAIASQGGANGFLNFANGDRIILFNENVANLIEADFVFAAGLNLVGDANANTLTGGADNDTIDGQGGADSLSGAAGDDSIFGGADADTLDGGGGNDTLAGGSASDFYAGGAGNDSILLNNDGDTGFSSEVVTGGTGNDTIDLDGIGNGSANINYATLGGAISVVASSTQIIVSKPGAETDTILNTDQRAPEIVGTNFADSFSVNGADPAATFLVAGLGGNDTIDGTGATTTISYLASTSGISVDLAAQTATDGLGGTDSLIGIGSVLGSSNNDTMLGSSANENLFGGVGADTLSGLGGNDFLFGGSGNDTIQMGAGRDTVDGGDGDDSILSASGNDQGFSFEIIRGSAGNDTINFDDPGNGFFELEYAAQGAGIQAVIGNDTGTITKLAGGVDQLLNVLQLDGSGGGLRIEGSDFADTITIDLQSTAEFADFVGGAGNDTLTGGGGFDRLSYFNSTSGVNVNIGTGIATDGFGGTDTFSLMDEVQGSNFADTLTGSSGDDRFILRRGNDTVDGLGGTDLVRYDRSGFDAINADLATGTVTGTHFGNAFTHTLTNIENLRGSNTNADTLRGDAGDNGFRGGGGSDLIDGRDGVDGVS